MTYLVIWINDSLQGKMNCKAFRADDYPDHLVAFKEANKFYKRRLKRNKTHSATLTNVLKSTDY